MGERMASGTAWSTETAGALSESSGIGLDGTLAEGRGGQSPHKNWLLLAFAKRVADGDAQPHETAFMTALMAADIPAEPLDDRVGDVVNTVTLLKALRDLDASALVEALAGHVRDGG